MKYFTIDQWIADQDGDILTDALESSQMEYTTYLNRVRSDLPPEFLPLTDQVVIHDARLLTLTLRTEDATLELQLDPGPHTQRNWTQLSLRYMGLGSVRITSDPDKGLPGPNGFGDLGYDEIEVLGGGMFEHRLLFSSGIELAVSFAAFRLERQ